MPRVDIAFNYTGLNYGEAIEVKRKLSKLWNIKDDIYTLKAKNTYWDIVEKYGWNFTRKGRRKANNKGNKGSVSEVCCKVLKHAPMLEGIKKYKWDLNFTGLRAEESRSRTQAGLRDGLFYCSKSWLLFRNNPILFWTNEMVWYVVKKESIPYAKIYDMIVYEKDEHGNDVLDKPIYKPRVGCWACVLSSSHGYFRFLKEYKLKQFEFLMKDKKLGELLFRLHFGFEVEYTEKGGVCVPTQNQQQKTENMQMSLFDMNTSSHGTNENEEEINPIDIENFDPDMVFSWVKNRPCKLEEVVKTKLS